MGKAAPFVGFVCLLLVVLVLSTPAWCQSSNGSVRGTVADQSKAVIPGAHVALTNTATNVESRTTTNEAGLYVFPAVAPGPYKLVVEFGGMNKFEGTLTVQVQQSSSLDVVMLPAGTQTVVSVQDVTPMVVTDSPALGHTLERTRIEQLPLNGRNIMNLLATVPGLTNDSNGALRTFGTRGGTHDVVLDGAALTDELYGEGSLTRPPSLESIQEFHVETNSTSARFSRQTSIIMTTKGGTNEIHGSLFETNRDNAYGLARARDNFSSTPAKLIRNEFGGSAGGPVYIPKLYNGKNRTFWFFAYEGFKMRSGGFKNYKVPTQAMRNGDFSGLVNSAGTLQRIYDPLTTAADGSRLPFNYGGKLNAIDPTRISPLMKYIYSVLPLPNLGNNVNPLVGNNYSAAAPDTQDQYTYTMRFDHRFTDSDQVYGRVTKAMASRIRPANGGVPALGGFGNSRNQTYPNESLSLDWTHAFSPSFFNEFMFSASRTVTTSFSGDPTRRYSSELGLPNPNGVPGYPVINNIGVGTGNSNYFQPVNWNMQYFNYFILEDNATKIKGRHELQFGVHLRHDQLNYMPQQQRTAGSVTFAPVTTALYDAAASNPSRRIAVPNTGHVAAAAYLGYANYEVRVAKGMYYMRQNEDSAYFQDNFRVNNRLTLNLGLRWQFSPYPYDKYNVMSSFDKKNMAIVLGQPLDKLYQMGIVSPSLIQTLQGYGAKFESYEQAGLPKKLVHDNWHDIGPHLGFAYRALDGKRSFVLRGGFSTNYNVIPIYGWNDRMRLNSPFAAYYQNYSLTDPAQSPDGVGNWGLVNTPSVIAGRNSTSVVSFDRPQGVTPGSDFFGNAYFASNQPSSRVHDWNLTMEKELMRDTVLRVAYIGNHAVNQDSYSDWNAAMSEYNWVVTTKTTPPSGTWSGTALRPNSTLPYADVQEYRKDGYGWANGAQIELERRYSKGLGFQLFYNLVNATKAASHGWYSDSSLAPASSFLPGSVPTNDSDRMRLLLYQKDYTVPQHEIRFNWIADLPFGKGKPLAGNSNRVIDAFIGGWQVSGMGRWHSNWFTLPSIDSNLWPTGTPLEYYGHKYPIQDCRDGECRPGYLMWNGYIPAHQINSTDASGNPNGVMGVPANYKPSVAPLTPYPANYNSINPSTDPRYNDYGTSNVYLPLNDGSTYRMEMTGSAASSPLHPWINQSIHSTNIWNCDASIFKTFTIRERVKLRVQADFFNVFNTPGNQYDPGDTTVGDGLVNTWTNVNDPRTTQLSVRLTW